MFSPWPAEFITDLLPWCISIIMPWPLLGFLVLASPSLPQASSHSDHTGSCRYRCGTDLCLYMFPPLLTRLTVTSLSRLDSDTISCQKSLMTPLSELLVFSLYFNCFSISFTRLHEDGDHYSV